MATRTRWVVAAGALVALLVASGLIWMFMDGPVADAGGRNDAYSACLDDAYDDWSEDPDGMGVAFSECFSVHCDGWQPNRIELAALWVDERVSPPTDTCDWPPELADIFLP